MYAKLMNGQLMTAPAMLRTKTGDIYNPTEDVLMEAGYKPVVEAPYPVEDEENPVVYIAVYEEQKTEIIQSWELQES